MDWVEFGLGFLTAASTVSAAAFGALGLMTEYKRDDRLTTPGKVALSGIVLSAALALGSQALTGLREQAAKRNADALAEKAERAADRRRDDEMARYGRQIQALDRLQGGLSDSLRQMGALQVTQQANTDRVISDLWKQTHIVGSAGAVVAVSIQCSGLAGPTAPPLLGPSTILAMRVTDGASFDRSGVRQDEFLPSDGFRAARDFWGREHRIKTLAAGKYDGVYISQQMAMFTPMDGDFGSYEDIGRWKDAAVLVEVLSDVSPSDSDLDAWFPVRGSDSRRLTSIFSLKEGDEGNYRVLPCETEMGVSLNGREVAHETGLVFRVDDPGAEERGRIMMRYRVARGQG